MKILLTGGGTGGHFYPNIAVAESINKIARAEKLLNPDIFYMAEKAYDKELLFQNNVQFKKVPAGKMRQYFSLLNIFDFFKMGWGILKAIFEVFSIYPDVIFAKGGYDSFPALFAAKLFGIPVVIHESDTVPGRVNIWAAKFAKKVALSYPEAAQYFKEKKVAYTGNPIRKEITQPIHTGAHEFLKLEENTPVILVLGGSQGAKIINDTILSALPRLVEKYQIIHQTGSAHFKEMKNTANLILENNKWKSRYKPYDYLNDLAMKMSAGVATLAVSRAGSTIFEIASWGLPSILIPITLSNGDHQRKNAFSYARTGAAIVIEEKNLAPSILEGEIDRLANNEGLLKEMREKTKEFAKIDAADKIARVLIEIGLEHESR